MALQETGYALVDQCGNIAWCSFTLDQTLGGKEGWVPVTVNCSGTNTNPPTSCSEFNCDFNCDFTI